MSAMRKSKPAKAGNPPYCEGCSFKCAASDCECLCHTKVYEIDAKHTYTPPKKGVTIIKVVSLEDYNRALEYVEARVNTEVDNMIYDFMEEIKRLQSRLRRLQK